MEFDSLNCGYFYTAVKQKSQVLLLKKGIRYFKTNKFKYED